jgi:hypothetical protein
MTCVRMRYNWLNQREWPGGVGAPPTVASSDWTTRMRFKSIPDLTPEQQDKFWAHVVVPYQPSCCWEWTASCDTNGRPQWGCVVDGQRHNFRAHRVAYTLLIGPIPDGMTLDHLCRNIGCLNPDHEEPVPEVINIYRSHGVSAMNRRKTHCKHGHEFSPENTRIRYKKGSQYRQCRKCWRSYKSLYDARRRSAA